tara:strand:- start:304 stop:711 length:408 start_codon:yes stop_codon:yes gene_type:complete
MGRCVEKMKEMKERKGMKVVFRMIHTYGRSINGPVFGVVNFKEKDERQNVHVFLMTEEGKIRDPYWGEFKNMNEYMDGIIGYINIEAIPKNEYLIIEGHEMHEEDYKEGRSKFHSEDVLLFAIGVNAETKEKMNL